MQKTDFMGPNPNHKNKENETNDGDRKPLHLHKRVTFDPLSYFENIGPDTSKLMSNNEIDSVPPPKRVRLERPEDKAAELAFVLVEEKVEVGNFHDEDTINTTNLSEKDIDSGVSASIMFNTLYCYSVPPSKLARREPPEDEVAELPFVLVEEKDDVGYFFDEEIINTTNLSESDIDPGHSASVMFNIYYRRMENKIWRRMEIGYVRPYQCSICKACLRYFESLRHHLQRHLGHFPFKCHTCPAMFTSGTLRDKHERNRICNV